MNDLTAKQAAAHAINCSSAISAADHGLRKLAYDYLRLAENVPGLEQKALFEDTRQRVEQMLEITYNRMVWLYAERPIATSMDEPYFERWVSNSEECNTAVVAANRGDLFSTITALEEAVDYIAIDNSETLAAFEEAIKYVEYKFGKSFAALENEWEVKEGIKSAVDQTPRPVNATQKSVVKALKRNERFFKSSDETIEWHYQATWSVANRAVLVSIRRSGSASHEKASLFDGNTWNDIVTWPLRKDVAAPILKKGGDIGVVYAAEQDLIDEVLLIFQAHGSTTAPAMSLITYFDGDDENRVIVAGSCASAVAGCISKMKEFYKQAIHDRPTLIVLNDGKIRVDAVEIYLYEPSEVDGGRTPEKLLAVCYDIGPDMLPLRLDD